MYEKIGNNIIKRIRMRLRRNNSVVVHKRLERVPVPHPSRLVRQYGLKTVLESGDMCIAPDSNNDNDDTKGVLEQTILIN